MALCISRQQHEQLLQWAREADRHECCGLMLGQGGSIRELRLAKNVALQPATHFEIDPATLIAAEKAERAGGLKILGYFHSHPNEQAQPSATDAEMAASDGRYWLVLAAGAATGWKAVPEGLLHCRFDPVLLDVINDAQG